MKAGAVLYVLGWLLGGLTLSMFVPALAALIADDTENALVFFNSAAVSSFFAGALIISLRGKEGDLNKRGSLLLIVLMWTVLPLFAAVPIYFSGVLYNPGKAFFEAVSGFTTTGATILTHLDRQPAAILLWRAILQWLGGLYTVLAASGIYAALGIGGLQLQYGTMPHGEGQTLFGRLRQTAFALAGIYASLTMACFLAFWAGGMPTFDSFCHAMSTVSTGGFSTRDASIGAFDSPRLEAVAAIFMILGAMNLTLHWAAAHGRWRGYRLDPEVRFLGIALLITGSGTVAFIYATDFAGGDGALRWGVFNAISFVTNTGFWTGSLAGTPLFLGLILLTTVLVGGSTGSTAGGFKLMRIGLVIKQGMLELSRLINPNEMLSLRYGKTSVKEGQIAAVWAVFVGLVFVIALATLIIALTGPSFEQSLSLAVAAISNAGPASAMFFPDPVTPYAALSEATRAVVIIGMIIGRIEVLALLMLLSPIFWRA